ncbi:hypothetical protein GPLA_3557 [Paraglaciecola polaris LMG 21857]|uniref:Uncharacterized protein n=1 Tax=Paraglaciecola polaris LMG 21857 TaxID=1129793 RepID=K7AGN9_9ALTE|nr:hypothetical protein GPLA_3557 [Paraglaciecola polaris LMG 21857]
MNFLSCLCGSERFGELIWTASDFLSCLCGSEPEAYQTKKELQQKLR